MRTISFKVSDDEALYIRQSAESERLSVSEYLRRKAVKRKNPAPVGKVRCDLTGAEIFGPLPDSSAMTTETVRRMLADFP